MRKLIYLFLLCVLPACAHAGDSGQQKELKELQEKAASLDKGYKLAVADGVKNVPVVAEFNRLFDGANNSISYYTGEYGSPEWNSKVGLYDRYVLTMQAKIELDEARTGIVSFGEPRFTLVEVEHLSRQPDGTHSISYAGNQVNFGLAEWRKLVEAGGDFLAVGVTLHKDRPLPQFSVVWKEPQPSGERE